MDVAPLQWSLPQMTPKVRNGTTVLFLSLITVGVYAIYWIYRLQREHPRRIRVDPSARIWFAAYWILVAALLGAFAASGYGRTWNLWADATGPQRTWYGVGLAVAVVFNVWFAIGTLRLTSRFHELLQGKPIADRTTLAFAALVVGIVFEMCAMIVPRLTQVALFVLPSEALNLMRLIGALGSGGLLSWAIVIHRQANQLAKMVIRQ